MSRAASTAALERWFSARGWTPSEMQRAAWDAWRAGESGLIHAPTGVGKTLAAWGGPLLSALEAPDHDGLGVLWLTPLRALARDTVQNLQRPLDELGIPWRVEARIGDTSSAKKQRQRTSMPQALVTTPESLSLLLSWPESARLLSGLRGIVVDEWHELLGSKRGTQAELGLARLRGWNPGLPVWGLSATLGNPEEALDALLGERGGTGRLLRGPARPDPIIHTLLPDRVDRFPWSGHIGLALLDAVVAELDAPGTALLFTNTRSQSERWHEAILEQRPGWEGEIALHHGSLSRKVREVAEQGLLDGSLRCVVATSSLDLGVDFGPVDRVFQVGSPKGVGRLLQRAGRSGHTPEGRSVIHCVPTQAIEVAEFAAVREAVALRRIEPRVPIDRPLDVLVQHLVTVAAGGGFDEAELFAEVRTTRAFRELDRTEWGWCLDFVRNGGEALRAYERYARVRRDEDGRFTISEDRTIARNHRMSIGTITSDGQLEVRFLKGGRLGTIEESFLARLEPGEVFTFAGRRLKLVRINDMRAYVRLAKRTGANSVVPRWTGGRMPISLELGDALIGVFDRMRHALEGVDEGADPAAAFDPRETPELAALAPLVALQRRWSALPGAGELLVERIRTREGHHLFLFPFFGRRVHDGLGALLAHRLTRGEGRTIHLSANDYGIELLSPDPLPLATDDDWHRLLGTDGLEVELLESLNRAELSKRHFREIARVSGLVMEGYPGRSKSTRQLQISSGLVHDVLERYDPGNLLLAQTRREVLEREIDFRRLREGLDALRGRRRTETVPERLTPLAFPIWAARIQAEVSTEVWIDRVRRMAGTLESAAGSGTAGVP